MTVVFFCPNILRDAHRHIFQLDRLKEDGYDFVIIDATPYYNNKSSATEDIIIQNTVKCKSEEDFVVFRNGLPDEPVLFITFDQYMKFAAPILDLIIRRKDKLLTYHTKRFSNTYNPSGKLRKAIDKLIIGVDKVVPVSFFRGFYRRMYGHYIPDYFLCSTDFLVPTKSYLTIKRRNRIIVHSDDINKTLTKEPAVIDKNRRVGVFLDQVIPFQNQLHPLVKDVDPGEDYPQTYYKNLEFTLNRLKNQLSLDEIVIALHPDAIKFEEEIPHLITQFRTFIGSSHELVRDSHYVFGHASTALTFAIFYKKPIILLKDKYTRRVIENYMTFFEKELDVQSVDMDRYEEINIQDTPVNDKKYDQYIRKYLKNSDIQENSFYYAIEKIKSDLTLRSGKE